MQAAGCGFAEGTELARERALQYGNLAPLQALLLPWFRSFDDACREQGLDLQSIAPLGQGNTGQPTGQPYG